MHLLWWLSRQSSMTSHLLRLCSIQQHQLHGRQQRSILALSPVIIPLTPQARVRERTDLIILFLGCLPVMRPIFSNLYLWWRSHLLPASFEEAGTSSFKFSVIYRSIRRIRGDPQYSLRASLFDSAGTINIHVQGGGTRRAGNGTELMSTDDQGSVIKKDDATTNVVHIIDSNPFNYKGEGVKRQVRGSELVW